MSEKLHSPYTYLLWGLVFIFVGVIWRLSLAGGFDLTWELIFPALLIVLGLALLISGLFRHRSPLRPRGEERS